MVLGGLVTFGQSLVVLLLEPIWNLVLFPRKGEAALNADPGPIEELFAWITKTSVEEGIIRGEAKQNDQYAALCIVVIFLILLAFLTAAAQYLYNQLANRVSLRMVVDLRVSIAKHLMGLGLGWHGSRKLGDTLSRVSSDVQQTLAAIKVCFGDLLQNGYATVAFMGVMAYAAPELSGAVILSVVLLAWPVSKLSKRVRRRSTKSLTTLGASVQVLTQMFQGIRTVRAFDMERQEVERYERLNEDYLEDTMRMVRAQSLTLAWTTLFSHVGIALLLFVVGFGAIWFDLFGDGGKMMIFFMGSAQMYNHIKRLTKNWTIIETSVGASERLCAVLEEEADVRERSDAHSLGDISGAVSVEGLRFAYPNSEGPALSGIDLEVRAGETLALVGPSGGGKSTLLSMICRFFDPDEGAVRVDGHDLTDVTLTSWRQQFSLVEQAPFLFHTTIRENIRYGRPDATQAEIEEALLDYGMQALHTRRRLLTPCGRHACDMLPLQSCRLPGHRRRGRTIITPDAPRAAWAHLPALCVRLLVGDPHGDWSGRATTLRTRSPKAHLRRSWPAHTASFVIVRRLPYKRSRLRQKVLTP